MHDFIYHNSLKNYLINPAVGGGPKTFPVLDGAVGSIPMALAEEVPCVGYAARKELKAKT